VTRIKLILDENLSESVLRQIRKRWPDSVHVRQAIRTGAGDPEVWEYARLHDFVIVTRDADFERLSALHGAPPKVIWLAFPNASNAKVVATLMAWAEAIERFVHDAVVALLAIDRPADP
jgi:predicted nuclease of predicted toxin-antitoxin system